MDNLIHPNTYSILDKSKKEVIRKSKEQKHKKAIDIITKVCEYYGVTDEQLKSKSRRHNLVVARQVAMFFVWKSTKFRFGVIANYFNRERTTVIYAVETIEGFLKVKSPDDLIEQINELREIIDCY